MIDIRKMTVAIVDDIETMCKSIRGMMKILGFGERFLYGYNGREALEILREHPVDLIIMDLNMPIMGGLEALGHIREDSKQRDLPVVMVTAEADREMVAQAGESEIDAYLLKPLSVKSLGDRIVAVVEKVNHPSPMFVHLKTARSFKERRDYESARKEIALAMKEDPASSKPPREMGLLYYELGNLDAAEKYLLKASEMNRFDVFAFHCLGELYLKKEDIDSATRFFEKAMKVSPRHISRGLTFGKALVKKGAAKKAEKIFEKALGLAGDDSILQEDIANFCLSHNVDGYAVRLYKAVLKKKPGKTDVMMRLGIALKKTSAIQEAVGYFSEVEKKEPSNLEVKFALSESYIALKQPLRAEKVVRSILEIAPDNSDAKEILKRIV